MLKKLLGFIGMLTLTALLCSCASPPEKMAQRATMNFNKKQYVTAFNEYQNAAQYEWPYAEYMTGYMYYYGLGVKRDPVKARKFFILAADRGYDHAIHALTQLKKNEGKWPAFRGL